VGLQRIWPVLGRDCGEHEDPDERLALSGALRQAEASAVRCVLDQRAQALKRRGTLSRKVWRARLVLELADQLFRFCGGVLGTDALLLAQSRVLLLELLETF
jgi:hypothetical protein